MRKKISPPRIKESPAQNKRSSYGVPSQEVWQHSVRFLKGVGPRLEVFLQRLGISQLGDLCYYFPLRYEDRRTLTSIKDIVEGESFLVSGKVLARNVKPSYLFRGAGIRGLFEILLGDNTGNIKCVWFNQPYLKEYINVGEELLVYGKTVKFHNKLQFNSPQYEKVTSSDKDSFNFGRIVGIYRLTEGLTQKKIRKIIFDCLGRYTAYLEDPLPFTIRGEKKFSNISQSLKNIHFPPSFEEANAARERFIFEELFFSQIMVYLRKAKRVLQKGIPFTISPQCIQKMRESLPFRLTPSQENALGLISEDMQKSYPMHRLLQGDVGSGKTAVALFALAICADNGFQASLMVPTEVLAYQHYKNIVETFKDYDFNVGCLVSSITPQERQSIMQGLRSGTIDIVIGTHSLLEEDVKFKQLGLVIIDEQHKFGVAQRALLPKKGVNPDCLVMSATPIPRSLALSLYGDLDLAIINELPPGRKSPQTIVREEDRRKEVYEFVAQRLRQGRQAYIIYPVIEESQDIELQSLKEKFLDLKKEFKGFHIEMFHGRLQKEEKLKIIEQFKNNKIKILVATTVIEVGIDIENATVMVVENPERFGLAQLHQLRGRIRRSVYEPYFILIKRQELGDAAKKRLAIIEKINDGFKLAEEDLLLRGPGDFFGHFQWGFPALKIANPLKDIEILKDARKAAYQLIKKDPYLNAPHHKQMRKRLQSWLTK